MSHSQVIRPIDQSPEGRGTGEAGWLEPPLWSLVGNTPLVPLAPSQPFDPAATLLLKAEWLNPGGSVKDRAAREILSAGLTEGALPGRRLLDASSGNTAVAYAMLGAAAGVGVTVCVPANASIERRSLLKAYGAEVIETDPLEGSDGAIQRARALAAEVGEQYWYADQYGHPANPGAHFANYRTRNLAWHRRCGHAPGGRRGYERYVDGCRGIPQGTPSGHSTRCC